MGMRTERWMEGEGKDGWKEERGMKNEKKGKKNEERGKMNEMRENMEN